MSVVDNIASLLLSPNLDRLSVQPPSRLHATATALANVAPGFAQPTIKLPIIHNRNEGLYFTYVGWDLALVGALTVTIVDTLLVIIDANGNEIAPLGVFTTTDLSLFSGQSNDFVFQKPLWTAADLDAISLLRNSVSIFAAGVQPLELLNSVGGTATGGSNFSLDATAQVSLISGLEGADTI